MTLPLRQTMHVKKIIFSTRLFITNITCHIHDDVIKWKHFPRYWPFVRRIHRSPVNSPHKGQWRGALMFTLICARIKGWVNNCEAGDLRRKRAHYDVIVMLPLTFINAFGIYESVSIDKISVEHFSNAVMWLSISWLSWVATAWINWIASDTMAYI